MFKPKSVPLFFDGAYIQVSIRIAASLQVKVINFLIQSGLHMVFPTGHPTGDAEHDWMSMIWGHPGARWVVSNA